MAGSDQTPGRRWRFDDQAGPGGSRASGRWAVLVIVSAILTLWLGLDLAFRGWKDRYRALAEFGASKVAPAVDPLALLRPPGVDPPRWRSAVEDTHAMLLALTGSGVLDRPRMEGLRREISAKVEKARAETALAILAGIWDDLEARAGPVIAPDRIKPPANSRHAARHPRPRRPEILGPSGSINRRR
ncbi:hypothetical protein P12x_005892 [Tundrisphaera lichenicola]|uniref:hypothetical protein n=1 Tax=Tundrisphaera lichenicola TaxID=2029860 RepID=UPI003EBA4019